MTRHPRHRATAGTVAPAAGRSSRREAQKTAVDRGPRDPGVLTAAGALALVCALAFWNSFRAELILDNIPIIVQDPRLKTTEWSSLRAILAFNYWWPTGDSNLYRPLTTLTYWFNYSVLGNGANPAGYHAVNLLLHWMNAVLAFLLVRGVAGPPDQRIRGRAGGAGREVDGFLPPRPRGRRRVLAAGGPRAGPSSTPLRSRRAPRAGTAAQYRCPWADC